MERDSEDTLAATYAACTCGTITEDHDWGCASNPALPSRRVFRIEVGEIPPDEVRGYIDRIREEMRRPAAEALRTGSEAEVPEQSCCQCGHSWLAHHRADPDSEPVCGYMCPTCDGRPRS